MSAFSTEEIVESFKFLPRSTLDGFLLVCRQWNQLIKSFGRYLSLHQPVVASIQIYARHTKACVSLKPHPRIHSTNAPHTGSNNLFVVKHLEYKHSECQIISPIGPLKELFCFLDSHIRNSFIKYIELMHVVPPGVMCLIKDLIEGQSHRNCFIVRITHMPSVNVISREISLPELLKASLLSSNKSIKLIDPTKDINELGPFPAYWTIVSAAKPLRNPFRNLQVVWRFCNNFPEQFIEIFKNSRKDDWPEYIVVKHFDSWKVGSDYEAKSISDNNRALHELSRQGWLLEQIWPSIKEIRPDLRKRAVEIVHPNAEDGRRLIIEFKKYPAYTFLFKTISTVR